MCTRISPFIAPTSVSSFRSRFGGRAVVRFFGVLLVLLLSFFFVPRARARISATARDTPAHPRTPGDSRRRCPCASSAPAPCCRRRALDFRRTPSSGRAARRETSSPGSVVAGTFFSVTPRPPIRLPSRAGPAASSRRLRARSGSPGSCGHTPCSAHTFAVTGAVISLPSVCALTPGLAYTPRCECTSMSPGVTQRPFASITRAPAGALSSGRPPRFCRRDQHVAVIDARAGAGEHGRAANQVSAPCRPGKSMYTVRVSGGDRLGVCASASLLGGSRRRHMRTAQQSGERSVHVVLSRSRNTGGREIYQISLLCAADFVIEQPALAVQPAAVAGERAVGADQAMAGHDDADGVGAVREPDGAHGFRATSTVRQRHSSASYPPGTRAVLATPSVERRAAGFDGNRIDGIQFAFEIGEQGTRSPPGPR